MLGYISKLRGNAMVDFTKAVNNEHMIDGLNRTIRLNHKLIRHCDWVLKHASGSDLKATAEQLREMHAGHIEMISEIVLALGGAPARRDKEHIREYLHIGGHSDQAILSSLSAKENDLQHTYRETIKRLSASCDVVDVMNRTIDDAHKHRQKLDLH